MVRILSRYVTSLLGIDSKAELVETLFELILLLEDPSG